MIVIILLLVAGSFLLLLAIGMTEDMRNVAALLIIAGVMTLAGAEAKMMGNLWRAAAVDAGHAESHIDHDTHKREWRWLPRCAEGKP